MRYSLRTLLFAMLVGGPGLAMLWWLRHTWSVQVVGIQVAMLVAVTFVLSLVAGVEWLLKTLLEFFLNPRRKPE
jgi:hypothetical protein